MGNEYGLNKWNAGILLVFVVVMEKWLKNPDPSYEIYKALWVLHGKKIFCIEVKN